jgi:multiple sugar transport system substrate-binding protein
MRLSALPKFALKGKFTENLILAVGALLAGCGAPADQKIEIRYMAWGSPSGIVLEQKFCDRFNAQNPDVHVKLLLVPGSSYKQKLILMLASHSAPDVMRLDHYDFPNVVRKGYFYDVTDLAAHDKGFHRSDFFPITIQEGIYKNRLYGLNTMFGGQVIYYNQNMIREAGLEDPNALAKRGEWTCAAFRRYAIAMTKRDASGRPTQFGTQIGGFPDDAVFIWDFGGEILSQDGKRCLMDSPGAIQATQFLANLRWKDHCAPSPSQSADSAFTFESGKIGMAPNWSGMSSQYRKTIRDFDWDVCPMPTGPKSSKTMVKGNQLLIYQESAHPKAAWRFVRFLTSEPVERELYAKLRRNCPTRKAVAYSKLFLDGTLEPHHPMVFVDAVVNGRALPITARWSEWTTAFNADMDDLMSGRDLDAARVNRQATADANAVLSSEEGF